MVNQMNTCAWVSVMLRRGNSIALVKRGQNSNESGFYACPGGKVEPDESTVQALIREAQEEVGIQIKPEDLRVVHILHRRCHAHGILPFGVFYEVNIWEGEPQVMEPHKHDEIRWFDIDVLPEHTMPTLKHVLVALKKGLFYSEFGWEKN